MLGLPQSTEVKRPLPKAQLYKRFDWTPSQRECFDGDVARLDFVNWISPRTVPAIAEGNEVKEIFVVEVLLKSRNFDQRSIILLAKSIPQRVIYRLRFEDEAMLAVYYMKLFLTPWQHAKGVSLQLDGLNLNAVWENIVRKIGNINDNLLTNTNVGTSHNVGTSLCDVESIQHAEGMSLQEEIRINEERAKIERQIAALERQMNATKQPRRKRELFIEIQKLKKTYDYL